MSRNFNKIFERLNREESVDSFDITPSTINNINNEKIIVVNNTNMIPPTRRKQIQTPAQIIFDDQSCIIGEYDTPMLCTTSDALLDIFSSATCTDRKYTTVHNQTMKEKKQILMGHKTDTKNTLTKFDEKLNACLDKKPSIDDLKHFIAHGFYLRDIKGKGERTLFDLFFIKLWNYNSELAKRLIKFIVGSDNTDYFGCWKDLHQILMIYSQTDKTSAEYVKLYETFIKFEGEQLKNDWMEYIKYRNGVNPSPKISLCAKWLISSGKKLDEKLTFQGKSYFGNFCHYNTDLLIAMNSQAMISLNSTQWKPAKPSDHFGLQRILRKIKSTLNTHIDTIEQKMCKNDWANIKINHIPYKNLTKHRRAFNNEKSKHGRSDLTIDANLFPYGDKIILVNESNELKHDLEELFKELSNSELDNKISQFRTKYVPELSTSVILTKAIDRIICRLNLTKSSTHGTRLNICDSAKSTLLEKNNTTKKIIVDHKQTVQTPMEMMLNTLNRIRYKPIIEEIDKFFTQ